MVVNIFLLLSFCFGAFNLANNQVEITCDDYSAQIEFYNLQGSLVKELSVSNFYGYKITPEGKSLYVLNKDGINIYNSEGRIQKTINDKGILAVSSKDEYLVCASENIIRVYKDNNHIFQVKVKSTAIRQLVFSLDNQYLGIMARNEFALVSLSEKQIVWLKEFLDPLIFCKIDKDKIILVSETRPALNGKVYLVTLTGETLQEYNFCYQQYDEQIQDIEILHDCIRVKTYLRAWELGKSEQEQKIYETTDFTDSHRLFSYPPNQFNPWLNQDTIPWPLPPTNIRHCLGNNWFEYQNYGGSPYFHPGIDIITPGDSGVPVYAVKQGIVKAWLTIGGTIYWRLGIADSSLSYTDSCNGYLYAHVDSARYHKDVGDSVALGELIGYLVPWPVDGFNHCHFAKIRDVGSTWTVADWAFVFNPLISVQPNNDTISPTFLNAATNQKFAFARNNTSTYLSSSNLNGDVDIVARIYDKLGISTGDTTWDRLIPLKIEYEIVSQDTTVPRKLSFIFSGRIPSNSLIGVCYKQDNTCRSRGDYDYRDYYFIVTNTDGDSIIESSDAAISWRTTQFPNGNYWIKIYAYDVSNNVSVCSMQVTVNNGGGVTEEENHSQFSKSVCEGGLFNSLGQKLSNLNLAQLKPGIYFYNKNGITHKLLIVKPTVYFQN